MTLPAVLEGIFLHIPAVASTGGTCSPVSCNALSFITATRKIVHFAAKLRALALERGRRVTDVSSSHRALVDQHVKEAYMPLQVCNGATLKCALAVPPGTSVFVVTPEKMVNTSMQPAANIMDHVPLKNVMPFGACMSLANPAVAAATSAALGVLTPMPCIPNTPAPWVPGSPTVLLKNFPALNNTSTLQCMWGGVITVLMPGQTTHFIP
jgi:hypothetical protein